MQLLYICHGYSRTDPLAPLFVQQQPQLGQLVLPPELGLATQQVQPQEGGAAAVVGKRTVVAEKRDAALLLDKIMFALKRAMKNKDGSPRAGGSGGDKQGSSFSSSGVGETVGQGGRFGGTGVVTPNDMVAFAGVSAVHLLFSPSLSGLTYCIYPKLLLFAYSHTREAWRGGAMDTEKSTGGVTSTPCPASNQQEEEEEEERERKRGRQQMLSHIFLKLFSSRQRKFFLLHALWAICCCHHGIINFIADEMSKAGFYSYQFYHTLYLAQFFRRTGKL